MGSSYPVIVVIEAALVPTDLTLTVQPTSGAVPLTLSFQGRLSRSGVNENQPDSAIVDDETIILEIFSGGAWVDTGVHMTTMYVPGVAHGFYNAEVNVDPAFMPPGSYQFRTYYAGNDTKGLEGC